MPASDGFSAVEMGYLQGEGLPSVGVVLLPITGAARRARDVVTEACLGWELAQLLGPASLVATELVTNAVMHARTMMNLRVIRDRGQLRIEVCDGSPVIPALPAPLTAGGPDRRGGRRGLMIVDRIADRWGCWQGAGGKVVWAVLRFDLVWPPLSSPERLRRRRG
ncbi:ATP-binding protein [Actinoplanes sp. NBC_00393]|uniref:ATP-binding protein n=1 Tax=Actinoplanes sp. NBC_00393 TaxID=2975953 RepID=UPI002E1CEE9A